MKQYIKIGLLILVAIIFATAVNAQEELPTDEERFHIIHLKNGSALIGILKSYAQDRPATIQMGDGELITVPYPLIHKIERVEGKPKKSRAFKRKEEAYAFANTGWHFQGGLGFLSRGQQYQSIGLSLEASAVYHLHRLLGLGLSIGVDSYNQDGQNDFIPVQFVINGYLSESHASVFYSLGIGYGISMARDESTTNFEVEHNGGFSMYPKIGVRLKGKEGLNMTIFSGLKIQKASLRQSWGGELEEFIKQERKFNRIIVGMGFVF